jgi:glycine cleavage system aminomethyltransferase T
MARIDAQGHVNRQLSGIVSSSELHAGEKLYKGAKEIGKITSPVFSWLLQQNFAIGYVRREFGKDGETIEAGDSRQPVTVKQIPLSV